MGRRAELAGGMEGQGDAAGPECQGEARRSVNQGGAEELVDTIKVDGARKQGRTSRGGRARRLDGASSDEGVDKGAWLLGGASGGGRAMEQVRNRETIQPVRTVEE